MSQILNEGFDGAKLKLQRANRHLLELTDVMRKINEINAEGFMIEKQVDGSQNIALRDLGNIGEPIPTIIGDCIHNFRSSLDHIWMALMREAGETGFTYFPFHETRINLEDAIKKSPVYAAFPKVREIILDGIKPHSDSGGNHVFWAITKLDKIDKHNTLIPIVDAKTIDHAVFDIGGGKTATMTNVVLADTPNLGTIKGKIKQNAKITIQISFPERTPLAKQEVIATLAEMSQSVRKSLELFREAFL